MLVANEREDDWVLKTLKSKLEKIDILVEENRLLLEFLKTKNLQREYFNYWEEKNKTPE